LRPEVYPHNIDKRQGRKGNGDSGGAGGLLKKRWTDKAGFPQEYFLYFKEKR